MSRRIIVTLLFSFLFSSQVFSYGFSLLTKPYLAHPNNSYERYSAQWVEFEATHRQATNTFHFNPTDHDTVVGKFKSAFFWSDQSIAKDPQGFEERVLRHIEKNQVRNESLLKVVKEADYYFTPEGKAEVGNKVDLLMQIIGFECWVPEGQLDDFTYGTTYSVRLNRPLDMVLGERLRVCRSHTRFAENNVLSRWYRYDYVVFGKSIYRWNYNDRKINVVLEQFVNSDEMAQMIVRYALRNAEVIDEFDDLDSEALIAKMLEGADDLSIQPVTLRARPEWELYFVTVGVGGGNGYDFFFRVVDGRIELEYSDFDGDISFRKDDYNKDLIDNL